MVAENEQLKLSEWKLTDYFKVDQLRKQEGGSFFGFFMDLIFCCNTWNLAYFQCNVIQHFLQVYFMKDIHGFHKNNFHEVFESMLN